MHRQARRKENFYLHMGIKNDKTISKPLTSAQMRFGCILAGFTAFIILNNSIYFTPGVFGLLYYGLLLIITFAALCGWGILKLNIEMWGIYAVCWLSILLNDIPAIYSAEYRCITFILVTLLVSPAITSEFLAFFRFQMLQYLLKCCIIISVLSFIGRFVGFSMYLADTGLWCGITAHAMLLGPIAGLSSVTLFYELLTQKYPSKVSNYWRIFAFISSIFCLIGAASRTSIIGVVISLAYISIKKASFQKFIPLVFVCFIVCLFSFSFISSTWENIAKKNKNDTYLNLDSRSSMWEQRIREFKESPFCGIGFSSMKGLHDGNSVIVAEDGKTEPGSGWLMILSTMGICGGLAFLLLINNTIVRISQVKQENFSVLLFALLIFWALEMCAEGFIFASGSVLCFLFWSVIGAVEGVTHQRTSLKEIECFSVTERK